MPCKIEIRKTIQNSIDKILPNEMEVMSAQKAKDIIQKINHLWGDDVASLEQYSSEGGYRVKIRPLNTATEREFQRQTIAEKEFSHTLAFFNDDQLLYEQEKKEDKEDAKYEGRSFQQKETVPSSTASPKTIAMIKDLLKAINVDIAPMQRIIVNGTTYNSNAVAVIMQKIVAVVEGREAESLPEEAMHFIVEILKQTNPTLYKKLMGEINQYRLTKTVFDAYSSDPNYQTKYGKPDVVKLKEEAIAKVLAEIIIKHSEGTTEKPELLVKTNSIWKQIIEYFKGLFIKSGFDRVAMDIISGKLEGTADDIRAEEERVFFQKNIQESIYNSLREISSKMTIKDDDYYIDGKKIKRRVTSLVKTWYDRMFSEKKLLKDEFAKAVDDLKAEEGTLGHAAFEFAFHKLVDENGYLRETPLPDDDYDAKNPDFPFDMYEILRDNLKDRLESFGRDARFMAEVRVYDPKRDLGGTMDLLIIKPNGKVSVLDWKFVNLNTERYDDIPWYKVNAWRQQMTQYKLILQQNYGVKPDDFEQMRMIPIQAIYSETDYKNRILPVLQEVRIGDVDIKNVTKDFLLPVGLENESTGKKEIDSLIEKLNAVYKRMSEKKVSEADKKGKAEQLNFLFKAIRQLQVRQNILPLIHQSYVINKQVDKVINKYNSSFVGKDPKLIPDQEISDFANEMQSMMDALNVYKMLDAELAVLFPPTQDKMTADEKDLYDKLTRAGDESRRYSMKLERIIEEYTAEIIAKSVGVDKFLSPEKVIRGITKLFVSTAGLQLRSVEILYKKANKAFGLAGFETLSENKILEKLKESYEQWAKSKGIKPSNFDIIKKKDSNELIDQFDDSFYEELHNRIAVKDADWIVKNINVPAYREHLKALQERELERIKNSPNWILSEDEYKSVHDPDNPSYPAEMEREMNAIRKLYNTETLDSIGWLLEKEVKKFPKNELWESDSWKELNKPENAAAKDFYDYIIKKNHEYRSLGYITNPRTFLPFVRKSLTEKLVTGGNIRLGEQFFRSISIDEGDIGYGKIDTLSGKPKNYIPKYFTSEIDGELSTDLFKTFSLYNESAIRYKYLSQIEDQIIALVNVERAKKAIATSIFGKTERENGELQYTKDNSQNAKLVEDMMKAIIYGQKYIESETFDQLLFKLGTWGKTINEKMGLNIFPEDLSERQVSINKVITQLNSMFQLTALGLNVTSAASNFFGGTAQSMINAGTYFTKGDYLTAENMIFMDKFNSTDKKKMVGALEYFLPLTENYNRELAKKLSVTGLTQESLQDALMILMRETDLNVQTCNFFAFLSNSIVIDNKVVNAREYMRSLPEYDEKYAGNAEQRKLFKEKFEEDVKKLIAEKGVLKLGKIEKVKKEISEGRAIEVEEFVIPGVDRMSESVIELRRKVQQLSKDALGNLTEDDIRMINSTVYGKSMMMFKNWIPRLVDVRMGNLKYNSATDAYEWGRTRTVVRILADDFRKSLGNLYGILIANDRGINVMRELYEKKKQQYQEDTGKDLKMTETEFIDLVKSNVRNQIFDLIVLSSISILYFGIKAAAPDDDDDDAIKNQHKFAVRMLDKFRSELWYFYDPTSLTSLVSSGIFPSVSLLNNFRKGISNFFMEMYGIVIEDDKIVDDTKVIKYWMRSFPLSNQIAGYLPMFYPDMAKDLGIRVQANYGIR